MKRTFKLFPILIGTLLFFSQCDNDQVNELQTTLQSNGNSCLTVQTLWAGAGQNDLSKGTDVGTVTAEVIGEKLVVTYSVKAPWGLTEAHLWAGNDKRRGVFPRQAAPGLFPFKGEYNLANEVKFEIDLANQGIDQSKTIYVSAHGVVKHKFNNLDAMLAKLPEKVTYSVDFNNPNSYFLATLKNGDFLNGTYESYCTSSCVLISLKTWYYDGKVYSSYGNLTGLPIGNTGHLPAVNWIMNNISVGSKYSAGDIQLAIWELLDNPPCNPEANLNNNGFGFDRSNINEIKDRATKEGKDFFPGCGQKLVLIIWDTEKKPQPILITVTVPCGGGDETAWAFGGDDNTFIKEKISNKWGWIFEVGPCNQPSAIE